MFYGTFNPVHNGHIEMAKYVKEVLKLDEVLLIPLRDIPHKSEVASVTDRLAMCRLATQGTGLSTYDISTADIKGYDLAMIDVVSNAYPADEIYYIVGSDVFENMPIWQGIEHLLQTVTVVVVMRHDAEQVKLLQAQQQLEAMGGHVIRCEHEILPISSSQIRKGICHADDSLDIASKVLDYILEHNLYR